MEEQRTSVSWLPLSLTTNEPLLSLQSCPVNLNPMCDFHVMQKYETYLADWKRPGPEHCKRNQRGARREHPAPRAERGAPPKPAEPIIHSDRLGVRSTCEPFA